MFKVLNKKIIAVIIIIICIFLIGGIYLLNNKKSDYKLKKSTARVRVTSINDNEIGRGMSYDLQAVSIYEIFNDYDTDIVRGKVKSIEPIRIKVGEKEDYRAIVTVTVDDVIRGEIKKNEMISILVPINSTIATISSKLQVGDEGIFMPVKYDDKGEKYFVQSGSDKLVLKDISDYGLLNGVYWLFIEKNRKVVFEEGIYNNLTDVKDLYKVSNYIKEQLDDR